MGGAFFSHQPFSDTPLSRKEHHYKATADDMPKWRCFFGNNAVIYQAYNAENSTECLIPTTICICVFWAENLPKGWMFDTNLISTTICTCIFLAPDT